MKFSSTGLGVLYLGTSKLIVYSLGAHNLEIVMGKAFRVLIGSTESVCSPYDAFKKKKKGKCDFRR